MLIPILTTRGRVIRAGLLCCVGWLVVTCRDALAQGGERGPRPFEVNLHAGVLSFEDPIFEGDAEILVGGRLTYRLPNNFGLGGNYDWATHEFTVVPGPPASRLTADVHLLTGDINYMFKPSANLRPFAGAGLGAAIFSFDVEFLDELEGDPLILVPSRETHLVVPFFAGLYWVNRSRDPKLAFRTEVRAHMLNTEASGNTFHLGLSAGVSLFWGRPEPR